MPGSTFQPVPITNKPMATINLAYTGRVNPEGTSPEITREQLWKAMARKVARGDEFVAAIEACEVESTEDNGNVVNRIVKFKDSGAGASGMPSEVRERCVLKEPSRTDFHQPNGTFIQNIISTGADGELYLTYSFEFVTKIEKGSKEEEEQRKKFEGLAKISVEHSIEVVRQMVEDGRIQ